MSITKTILSLLLESRFRYKGLRVNLLGLPGLDDVEIESIHRAIYRLCKRNYIVKTGDHFKLTKSGEKYAYSNNVSFGHFLTEKQPKNLILMFDIPESRRKDRGILRRHLRNFHYIIIQKSVWVGPSPLPKEFLEYLESSNLKDSIKTFKLAKGYIVK